MKGTFGIFALYALITLTTAQGICNYCEVLTKCQQFPTCKHYAEKCNCQGNPQCGVMEVRQQPRISTFIIGGDDAGECELPWTVVLLQGDAMKCGGSIVDERHIVTAAHCLQDIRDVSDIIVGVGSSDRRKTRNHTLSGFVLHPEYRGDINDIAVIRLTEKIEFNRCARPICLPDIAFQYKAGKTCIVAGWGLTSDAYLFQPFILQKVKVPLIDWHQCNTAYDMQDTQLCAGYFEKGERDACKTDSGGPLICNYGNQWTLVGVVSSGIGCALPGYPGKYTDVAKFRDWIDFVIKD